MSSVATKNKSQRNWFSIFAATIIVIGAGTFLFVLRNAERSFPPLPAGAYAGQISGVTSTDGEFRTLYVERVANTNALLFVIFSEGWRPQFAPVQRIYAKLETESLTEDVPLSPVTLTHGSVTYTLFGRKDFNQYSGEISGSDGSRGVWSLRPTSADELTADSPTADRDLLEWLPVKARYTELKRSVREVTAKVSEARDKLSKLEKFITQEDLLRARADERKHALEAELAEAEQERKSGDQEVAALVSELEMLGRITQRGKAVNLARKVAARENRWYLVNWGAQEDIIGLEEESATRNVDTMTLEKEYKAAQERAALQRQVAEEKKRIAELKAQLAARSESVPTDAVEPTYNAADEVPPVREKEKSLWDSLWGD